MSTTTTPRRTQAALRRLLLTAPDSATTAPTSAPAPSATVFGVGLALAAVALAATALAVTALAAPLAGQAGEGTPEAAPTDEPSEAAADTVTLRIGTAHGSEAEQATAEELRRLVREHRIPRAWILTDTVVVDQTAIPHSHPVLTVHTRNSGAGLLATFLHEQFHWLEDSVPAFRAAMDDFAELYPEAPYGSPEGARDRESTWRHLVVNDLELQAASALFGEEEARRLLAGNRFYTWIYRTVLEDPRVREVTRRHGLVVDGPDGPGWR